MKSTLIFGSQKASLKTLMPKAGRFTRSRVYKAKNGKILKWKNAGGLTCVCPDTGFNLAHHGGPAISPFEGKLSTLEIFDQGRDVQGELVAIWVIMETLV
ncbi:hypothetical protein FRC08_018661 [Ceratobasidium sp. 394]|nr:hypothetical protein FRC08_018661 [Ceratobasidium sp. 394]